MCGDDAVSEVIGFSLILVMIILALGIWAVHTAPQFTEDLERTQNENILRQFAAFKYDLDSFLAAGNTGVYGRKIFTYASGKHPSSIFTFSRPLHGRFSMERGHPAFQIDGTAYYPVVFTYRSANRYAENIVLELRDGVFTADPYGLTLPGYGNENSAVHMVVSDSSFVPWVISGEEEVIVSYRLERVLQSGSGIFCVFDFSMR
ncbi:hypothetical protein [Methanocorpusculum vombati]|uniref:Uncharacterized protein n=1 Tax=Methanocorpusculum vombati TaxID=3002864 RepID=A0ABT4IL79_9EURY|nr:hypothetical protein [Methanocorpusculum vombati]MCZ9318939.1 hypothetical protein [Methanocorpusculum sp.]MCZ0862487.1 hypothetical protein [Methanocorpusculum vombati]MDE2521392.1 hypothetical protein [Methanocorpusculum sp.]MDE2533878.1 hypothetical protein [Methanocorpusculum sp.]MDE2546787.1 hypothetical protein [Methanocorpusculum sp.]